MIIRSKIHQSFQTPYGFTLSVGDNVFSEPLVGPVAVVLGELRTLGLVEFVCAAPVMPPPPPLPDFSVEDEAPPTVSAVKLRDPRPGPKKTKRRGRT